MNTLYILFFLRGNYQCNLSPQVSDEDSGCFEEEENYKFWGNRIDHFPDSYSIRDLVIIP